jgi:outer membrane protein TolC
MIPKTRFLILLAACVLLPAPLLPQTSGNTPHDYSLGTSAWPNFTRVYDMPEVPEVELGNSPRLDQLVREGKLYLSLSDAIALAIENNLDIAYARYGPRLADADILRAKSGGQLRGVQTQISTLSTGQSAAAGGGGAGGDFSGIEGRAGGGGGGVATGDASSFFGTAVPNLDPALQGNIDWGHFSNPQTSNFTTGTNTFVRETSNSGIGITKGFLSGGRATIGWNNTRTLSNNVRTNFNPSVAGNIGITFRQPLWQGFGRSLNSRNITVAKNNREVSDLGFKQQVIETVAGIQSLYWDLVTFIANVRAREEDLRLSQKLYDDNRRRVEIGTLAPIEIVRAEAEVAAREQDLTLAVTRVQQQETIIKNAISKNGLASPSLLDAQIVPTDHIEIPEFEQIQPMQDLMTMALQARPEIVQSRIRLQNTDINLKGVRNAMMPQIDFVADVANNGLSGQVNQNFLPIPGQEPPPTPEFFLGGLGNTLSQVFRRNFPDYQIGVQLSIPLKNRRAQADMAAGLLEKRQGEIRLRQSENGIRQEVKNATIRLQQARAQFQAAEKSRILQERTLDAEQKKFNLGASAPYDVVLAQRDLALARTQEIVAQNSYVQAKIELYRSTGQTLQINNISIDDAYSGNVSKPPDPIPPTPPVPQASNQLGIQSLLR